MATAESNIINPYTETVAFSVPLLPRESVGAVVDRARAAFLDWRLTTIEERCTLAGRFVACFQEAAEQAAADITLQMGKPVVQSRNEVQGTIERAEHMIAIAETTLADEPLPPKPGFERIIRHEPLGVVFDIAAWNYPLLIAVNVVVPAVLAGNAVILKHSNKTPRCGEIFADCFARAGAPDGLVQAVACDHATASDFIAHPGINYVSFTGSTRGGHEVTRAAADRFIDVGLELGGKDPAYVCADAAFEFAVENCVDGAFYNAGQSCCAIERIYVDRGIYSDFVEAFCEIASNYTLGDPAEEATTLGPLAAQSAPAFLAGQLDDAVAVGGRLALTPDAFATPETGWFAAPGVIADAPQDCALMQEESFGPVIGITPVSGDEEAVRYMNDSPYGLTASIWTDDAERARRVAGQIDTGTVYMNRCDYLDPALPWTGVKDTGRGCSLSRYGLLQLTRRKSLHLRTEIPS
jgi:acyl-CoA reductase-like NAD-dependent aldehyde dehydrogenase